MNNEHLEAKDRELLEKMNFCPQIVSKDGDSFSMKIGGTTFDVHTFWNKKGTQSFLQQFMDLLMMENEKHI